MPAADTRTDRLIFLDWVRILAFGVLLFYHVGMYYVSWDFHIKSPHADRTIEPLMRLFNPWRMDLLFLVSGSATSFMLLRDGASDEALQAAILAGIAAKPERHEFNERPQQIVRFMSQTGG